jgi:hypothetical protein
VVPILRLLNDGISFLLELALLASVGYWGFAVGPRGGLRWLLALGLPLLVAMGWGVWLAPKAAARLTMPGGVALSLLLFLLAAAALYATEHPGLALLLAAVALLNRLLILIWRQW